MSLIPFQRALSAFLSVSLCVAGATASRAEESPIPIAVLLTLTGDTATPGNDCRAGVQAARALYAAEDRVGTRRVRFIFADTKGQPATAVSEFQRMINVEKAAAVLNQRSQTVMATNPLSRTVGVALLGITGQSEFVRQNPYAFRFWPAAAHEAQKLAELFDRSTPLRLAMLTVEDEYTLSVRDSLRRLLKDRRVEVVYDATVNPSEQDFAPCAAAIKRLHPEYVMSNLAVPQNGAFVKKLREVAVRSRVIGSYWASLGEFVTASGVENAEGVEVVVIDHDKPELRSAYARGGLDREISSVGYTCFTAVAALLQAVRQAAAPVTRESLHEALTQLRSVELPGENLRIEEREVLYPLRLKRYAHGQLVDAAVAIGAQ